MSTCGPGEHVTARAGSSSARSLPMAGAGGLIVAGAGGVAQHAAAAHQSRCLSKSKAARSVSAAEQVLASRPAGLEVQLAVRVHGSEEV